MKHNGKTVRTASYVAGIFAIASALLAMVLLVMSGLGFLFPRKVKITLHTDTISKIYDAAPLTGEAPIITYGLLEPGHELVVTAACEYTEVGEYKNKPRYMIVDASGSDVTDMYEIEDDFGKIIIDYRPLVVRSASLDKPYDGDALVSGEIYPVGSSLAEGHSLVCYSETSITDPGEQEILPTYSIVDASGADVTDQYSITNDLGRLTVHPLLIYIQTASAEKNYDGKPLSNDEWVHWSGSLLDGHELSVKCKSQITEVGSLENEADVSVYDENGKDVSAFYETIVDCGILEVTPIPLYITTESRMKEYDGKPLSCEKWAITAGELCEGDDISLLSAAKLSNAGEMANEMTFAVTDREGKDVSHRYRITQDTGRLTLTPRAITLRTGSAAKVYDGTPLSCEEYQIINGSLCEGETLKAAYTSIVNIGYTQNYIIDYAIHKESEDGTITDVGGNYRITFDYGTLTVTAK